MGCISTQPPKENMIVNSMRSQTELMLKLTAKQNNQLQVIIDDDKYRNIPNTVKSPIRHKMIDTDMSASNEYDSYSNNNEENSVDSSSESSHGITPGHSVVLMGFAQNNSKYEESDSEPSLLQTNTMTKGVVLMGYADKNEIFVHSNNDLNNRNSNLSNYSNRYQSNSNDNNDNAVKTAKHIPAACC